MRFQDLRQNRSDVFRRTVVGRPLQPLAVDGETQFVRLDEVVVFGVEVEQICSKIGGQLVAVEDGAEAPWRTGRPISLKIKEKKIIE